MKNIVVKICRNPRIMLSQEYNNIRTKICSRGGAALSLVSTGFISNINRIKDYEVTSRNTSLS